MVRVKYTHGSQTYHTMPHGARHKLVQREGSKIRTCRGDREDDSQRLESELGGSGGAERLHEEYHVSDHRLLEARGG